jgi:hypothetical protein
LAPRVGFVLRAAWGGDYLFLHLDATLMIQVSPLIKLIKAQKSCPENLRLYLQFIA